MLRFVPVAATLKVSQMHHYFHDFFFLEIFICPNVTSLCDLSCQLISCEESHLVYQLFLYGQLFIRAVTTQFPCPVSPSIHKK